MNKLLFGKLSFLFDFVVPAKSADADFAGKIDLLRRSIFASLACILEPASPIPAIFRKRKIGKIHFVNFWKIRLTPNFGI